MSLRRVPLRRRKALETRSRLASTTGLQRVSMPPRTKPIAAVSARRRRRNAANPPSELRRLLFALAGWCCQCCGEPGTWETLTVSHIVARSRLGPDELWNVHSLLWPCHDYFERHPDDAESRAPLFGPNVGVPFRVAGAFEGGVYRGPHDGYRAHAWSHQRARLGDGA